MKPNSICRKWTYQYIQRLVNVLWEICQVTKIDIVSIFCIPLCLRADVFQDDNNYSRSENSEMFIMIIPVC